MVAGINGDFFNFSTGLPIGLVVSNGELKSSDSGYYAIGFKSDGSAVMGQPALKVSANLGYAGTDSSGYSTEVVRAIAGVNKARISTGGIYLYTYDFNAKHTTGNTESGVDVLCNIVGGSLAIGGSLTLQVASVAADTATATAVGQNQVVLSANSASSEYFTTALKNETVGNTITVSVSASDPQWNDVTYGIGALYLLVQNGTVLSDLPTGASPRTAVGKKADGTLVFYTIDGRRSGYSIGATMAHTPPAFVSVRSAAQFRGHSIQIISFLRSAPHSVVFLPPRNISRRRTARHTAPASPRPPRECSPARRPPPAGNSRSSATPHAREGYAFQTCRTG